MDPTLPENLRRLRVGAHKSQAFVAEAAGLSRVGYRNVETGSAEPRPETLRRIAVALGVSLNDLLRPTRSLRAVRFRAQKKMTSREQLLADVGRWLDDYNDLERLLDERQAFALADLAAELSETRQPARAVIAAERARQVLGLKEGDLIRDVCGLLEDHGVRVYAPALASEGFFGLSVAAADGGPAVVVNCWERISVERWIFTALHELGHLLLHLHAYDVSRTDENAEEEKEANTFASHFLMPPALFDQEWGEARGLGMVNRVFKMKRIFRVSWKTVVYRIASNASEPGMVWRNFYRAYRQQTGRSLAGTEEPDGLHADDFGGGSPVARVADEPERLLPYDFVEDRLVRLVRKAIEAEHISLGRGAEILRLDLRTMRNLVRTWLD